MSCYRECPRCGSETYEKLATHAYCVDCNYSPDVESKFDFDNLAIPPWAAKAAEEMEKAKKVKLPLWKKQKAGGGSAA